MRSIPGPVTPPKDAPGARVKFSPTLKLGEMKGGQSVTFMALERREKRDGDKVVSIFTVTLAKTNEKRSIFWPAGCQEPELLQPVRLRRIPEDQGYGFILDVPENDAERKSLWN